jgi:hypothetical protein
MMFPVSKCTLTHSLPKESTNAAISIGVIRKPLKKMFSMFSDTLFFSASGSILATASRARLSHTSLGTGSWSVRHGMHTAPGTTKRFPVPRWWAASTILAASSIPRPRLAGSLLESGYGQKRNEHSPLTAIPIRSAVFAIAANSFGPDFGERSLSRS